MLDYHAHIAALQVLESELAGMLATNPDPALPAGSDAVQAQPAYAAFGAAVDHVCEYTGDAERAITLLPEAAVIWKNLGDILARVAQTRQDLESLVINPAQPDILEQFNNISTTLQGFTSQINDMTAQLHAFFRFHRIMWWSVSSFIDSLLMRGGGH